MKPIDIIEHLEEDESGKSFGIIFEDGSVEWYDTIEEAESSWREKGN